MTFSIHHSGCIRWANNKKCPQEVPVGTSWNVLSQQIVKQKLKRYSVYINSKVKTKTVCVCVVKCELTKCLRRKCVSLSVYAGDFLPAFYFICCASAVATARDGGIIQVFSGCPSGKYLRTQCLKSALRNFLPPLHKCPLWLRDELIWFWRSKVKGHSDLLFHELISWPPWGIFVKFSTQGWTY